MSEENEHTSEETEAEMNAENHSDEQSKSETSMLNNETQQPMLEDEEMPTYISVSSPSRRDDSDVSNTKQQERIPMEEDHSRSPYHSDDHGGGSVYVLSSGDESNHHHNDEEEDEYADSEDMDEMDLENEHENVMLEEEEEEDEEDDEEGHPLRMQNDDDEDIEGEYEHECFDRASDDFILNNRLKQCHKERSLSLQDLSVSKNNLHVPFNKKSLFLNIFRHTHIDKPMQLQENTVVYPVTQKKQSTTPKYQHVESKVKQYIRDIKEQSRRSVEKRIKEQEYESNKIYEENENNDTDNTKPTVTNKTLKDYAEKAIKDLQHDENDDDNYEAAQVIENGENNKVEIIVTDTQGKQIRRDSEVNVYNNIQNDRCAQNSDDRLEKRNGSVDVNVHRIEYQNTFDRNVKLNNMEPPSLVNGHQQAPTLFHLRTLSYEEYMHGTSNKRKENSSEEMQEMQEKVDDPETYTQAEVVNVEEVDNTNAGCSLKIESVKSIHITQNEADTSNFTKLNATGKINAENIEIIQLKAQLNQRDAQFNNLRDAYQKALAENIQMKAEIDVLKKSLTNYEKENKPCETKAASVQTETITEPTSNKESAKTTGETNKISTSSVASTISSIDQWADSACSPAISIKPPDLTQILNSDDSIVLTDGTPRKLAHPLSRTFLTSSRILQTLSNITQGKSKVESPLVRHSKKRTNENPADHLVNLNCNSPIQASSSKKRKATDMLGSSTFGQPFKIPHTSTESEEKRRNSTASVEFKHSEEHLTSNVEEQNTSVNKTEDNSTSMENKVEVTDDHNDSVKCFIYRDHENSNNRSFLIQAEEPIKDRINGEKGRIQECGPYLLGNLEVRMSEINGTISIWGKEVDQECTTDNEDEMETSIKQVEKGSCHCWQKTPQTRFNGSPFVCSTNKKQKNPFRFSRSGTPQCFHTLSPNTIKSTFAVDNLNDRKYVGNHLSPHSFDPSCESCDSAKCRRELSTRRSISSSQEKLHSCSIHHAEFVDKECNCNSCYEKEKHEDILNHSQDKFHVKEVRRNLRRNSVIPDVNNHLHESIMNTTANINEVICKYNTSRRSLQNVADTSHSKYYNVAKDIPYTYKSSLDNTCNHEHSEKHTCCHSLSNDGEEDPLIPHKRTTEPLETRRRRLSGKRVRGILMDLLRGCGDCRTTNVAGVSKSGLQHKESLCSTSASPQIKFSPCANSEPQHSTQCSDRCCHAYARRIESQLEEFRMEMERVRSRSDAILDMLNILHSVDMN